MKKSKKIMMTMALGLSISALGFGVSANLDSNVAYAKEEQAPKNDTIDLSFTLLRKVGKDKEYNDYYKAEYVYINGVPNKFWGGKITNKATYKRGERVTFKLKETDEPGAPFVAEGEFDVPLVGYRNDDRIEIRMRELDQTQAKPEKEAPKKDENKKPENKDKSEANKKAIAGLRAAKKQAEVTLNACHLLIKFTPETIKSVRAQLDQLMVKQEKLIKQANNLLAKYE
ncbi:hypothetical protein [uncultured Anaerococcus sp.]|uniref:hypothetical protein n=1 Tax=uncultured Anaerococcus sp. TaxID=293428 RepID=UPI00288A4D78|nr:hypothetical protein [uncultured Anaerococcus sp.]